MENNTIEIRFSSIPENVDFVSEMARRFVSLYASCAQNVLDDICAAIREAVLNCVVHAYPVSVGNIELKMSINSEKTVFEAAIVDHGVGISDIEMACTPLFSTANSDECSGMGLTIIEAYTDTLDITSELRKGTTVVFTKCIN